MVTAEVGWLSLMVTMEVQMGLCEVSLMVTVEVW